MYSIGGKYFEEIVLALLALFTGYLLGQIYHSKKQSIYTQDKSFKYHAVHWFGSVSIIFLLLLELVGRIVVLTSDDDNEPHSILNLISCVMSITAVLFSLVSYDISEKRALYLNVLHLLWLWMLLGIVYSNKVVQKTASPTWHNCPLQSIAVVEIIIASTSFFLVAIDFSSFSANMVKKSEARGMAFLRRHYGSIPKCLLHFFQKIFMDRFKKQEEPILKLGEVEETNCFNYMKKIINNEKGLFDKNSCSFSMWKIIFNFLKPNNISNPEAIFSDLNAMFSRPNAIISSLLHGTSELLMFVPICYDLISNSFDHESKNMMFMTANGTISDVCDFPISDVCDWRTAEGGIDTCPASFQSFFFNPYVLTMLMFSAYLVQVPMKKYHDFMATRESIRLKSAIESCVTTRYNNFKMSEFDKEYLDIDQLNLVNFSITALYAWTVPIQIISCFLLMFIEFRFAGFLGCAFVLFLVTFIWHMKQDRIFHLWDMVKKRLVVGDEMVEHIKLLKIYGWQDLFCEKAVDFWSKKMARMWRPSIARMLAVVITHGTPLIASIVTFVLVFLSTSLTWFKVFSSFAISWTLLRILANQVLFATDIIRCAKKGRTAAKRLRRYFVVDREEEEKESLIKRSYSYEKRNKLEDSILTMMDNGKDVKTFFNKIEKLITRDGVLSYSMESIASVVNRMMNISIEVQGKQGHPAGHRMRSSPGECLDKNIRGWGCENPCWSSM